MNTNELKLFIQTNIPTFECIEILGAGSAFHYTPHYKKITAQGRFLGAPITANLDKTQTTLISPEASADPGIVFAYESIVDAKEEGFGCQIVQLHYKSAIRAAHVQEVAIGAPKTILIINTDITKFRLAEL